MSGRWILPTVESRISDLVRQHRTDLMSDDKLTGTLRNRIAVVLNGHSETDLGPDCACGWTWEGYGHADHVADAVVADLRAAGYAIVELPEPDEGRDDWLDGRVHLTHDGYVMHEEDDDGGHTCYTAGEARDLAAALVAAADCAEKESKETQ